MEVLCSDKTGTLTLNQLTLDRDDIQVGGACRRELQGAAPAHWRACAWFLPLRLQAGTRQRPRLSGRCSPCFRCVACALQAWGAFSKDDVLLYASLSAKWTNQVRLRSAALPLSGACPPAAPRQCACCPVHPPCTANRHRPPPPPQPSRAGRY